MRLSEQTRSISHEAGLRGRNWAIIDASDRPLGRVASRAASILRGKTRPDFTPNEDVGDFVVIINAAKVRLTGAKLTDKVFHRHTEYPGGVRKTTAGRLLETRPERLLEEAVRGMLPKTRLGRRLFTKLKVYRGAEHPHAAQKPNQITL
ncbi:MAG TPA: 50S ribosomal protein L13 [Candidatus Binataceae bacterium]|nr:50S ribosomal protein L13 [Candidatus Binataceae bacterium]